MRKKLIIPISLLAAGTILVMVLLSGCGNPIKVEGEKMANVHPWISWAITPSDSLVHSFNPMLHWFGADQDGQINNYFFGVFQAAYMDSAARDTLLEIPDTLTWIPLGNVTQATIPLIASTDTSVSVGQYVVLQAVDDQGDYSNILNRYLLRRNHRPTCVVTVPEDPQWVLPETTSTWHGIPVSWEGGDSLDYTGAQPDFLWDVRVFGPYPDSATAYNATINFDTTTAPGWYRLIDNDSDPYRISITSFNFYDLVTGFYIIFVRNFDDADVASDPAFGIIEVYEPEWIGNPANAKDVLIYNSSTFNPLAGNLPSPWGDSVQQFYSDVLNDAGIPLSKWRWFTAIPTIRDLYLYRLVIIDDMDWSQDVAGTTQEAFIDYLNAGGKIWVMGRMCFYNTSTYNGLYQYENNDGEPLVFEFIGLDGAYFPVYAPLNLGNAEFIGANAVEGSSTGLPDLSVDPLKIAALNPSTAGQYTSLPAVEYLILSAESGTETIYEFVSDNPGANGSFHQFPVAVRWESSTFRSAYFSFPLFMMNYDQASVAFTDMIDWFLQD